MKKIVSKEAIRGIRNSYIQGNVNGVERGLGSFSTIGEFLTRKNKNSLRNAETNERHMFRLQMSRKENGFDSWISATLTNRNK